MGPLPEPTIVHLDRGYDYQVVREVLAERGLLGRIASRGVPAPLQVGRRWVIERTHAWGNTFGELRWWTERHRQQVEFYLALACAVIVVRALIGRARLLYRWDGRPTARRLR
jgi:hypothetical protein